MKAIRGVLLLAGVLMALWGLWLMRDFHTGQLRSAGVWVLGGIVLHDGILAPLVVLYAFIHFKAIPRYARKPATIGLILWGTISVAVFNVLIGKGGKPDNHTVLNRPYVTTWLVMTVVLALLVGADIIRRRTRTIPAEASAPDSVTT